jgi:hypothetical protein
MRVGRVISGAGKIRALAMVTTSGALVLCGGCGATKASPSVHATTSATRRPAIVSRTPPTKQEIVKAKGCLKDEHVRPAKRTPYRPQVPHGPNEVTRNGLPMTPEEYEATVRRCLTRTNSASATAPGK